MEKIDTTIKRELKEWQKIFDNWSEKMNELYSSKNHQLNQKKWDRGSPLKWMKPVDEKIFNAWIEYEQGSFDIDMLGDKIE